MFVKLTSCVIAIDRQRRQRINFVLNRRHRSIDFSHSELTNNTNNFHCFSHT